MINVNYGHQIGLCYVKDNFAYVPVHKNASTWAIKYLTCLNEWKETNSSHVSDNCTFLVILRHDIINRWVSGMCEVLMQNDNPTLIDDVRVVDQIFEKITFECHTDTQTRLLSTIPQSQTIYFDLASTFSSNFIKHMRENYLHDTNCVPDNSYINASSMFEHKQHIIKKLTEYALTPKYNAKLKAHFSKDYELIDKVTYYS